MLKITLRPDERVVINGCVMRNGNRRQTLAIESRADIIRERDLLSEDTASTPVCRAYYLIQTALLRPETRDKLVDEIQSRLAELAACFGEEMRGRIVEAATHVSAGNHYGALSALRPVRRYETELLALRPTAQAAEAAHA